jgi:beta-glucanase (GH16 family)
VLSAVALLGLVAPAPVRASWPAVPPPLPAPTNRVVNVSTEAALQNAMSSLTSDTTIMIAAGTYTLTQALKVRGPLSNVTIRGATNNRDDVVLAGPGRDNSSWGDMSFGIWVDGDVRNLTIANLQIHDFYYHDIMFNPGPQSPHVYNVHLINAGQQLLKTNPNADGTGINNGIIEYSVFEYTPTSRDDYANAIQVLAGANWIIRNNLIRNIRAPQGQLAGYAVLSWFSASNTTVEGNTFINCQREIGMGLIERTPDDNTGGVVRNNFIYRDSTVTNGDVAIGVFDSPNTRVANNSILVAGTYANGIEYRFAGTTSAYITNNLLNKAIASRDGGQATVQNNNLTATAALFVDPPSGDLHLKSTASVAIDHATAQPEVTTDWDGSARPAGSAPDLGADEYGQAVSPPAPPAAPQNVRILAQAPGTDTTPPNVTVTAPASNATVSGASVTVSASAADNVGVVGVQFLLDGAALGAEDVAAPYTVSWNTGAVANGQHTLAARARDAAGNAATSAPVTVTVSNATPDTTPPSVSLTAPANSATVSGTSVAVSATASDNVGVAGVQFLVDGAALASEDLTSPYGVTWNTTTASDGTHTLSARARDAAGNTTTSGAVTVIVQNGTGQQTVTVTQPANGATVSNPALMVTATSSLSSLAGVQFTLDGKALGSEVTIAPYSVPWNTTAVTNGRHTLAAIARDSSGATYTSSSVTVTTVGAPPGDPATWAMAFNDEFNGTLLDRAKWQTTYPGGGRTNNDEMEWYVDDDTHHVVANGTLKLVATTGSTQSGFSYSSGMITSYSSFNQMYGYFEARMKIPRGQGFWPAFWLLPSPNNWPPEIDVMENVGATPGTVVFTNHWGSNFPRPGGSHAGQNGGSYAGSDLSTDFHTYGVQWTPTAVIWYVDGVERQRVTSYIPTAGNGFTGMWVLANLAVGGGFTGPPNGSTPFPSNLEIDYIRVFKQ